MNEYNKALLIVLPDYEFDFRNHDSDNSGLRYFEPEQMKLFWDWCKKNNLIPLGFCKTPRYRPEQGVGFLFEDIKTFEKIWFHIPECSYCCIVRDLFGEKELDKIWL